MAQGRQASYLLHLYCLRLYQRPQRDHDKWRRVHNPSDARRRMLLRAQSSYSVSLAHSFPMFLSGDSSPTQYFSHTLRIPNSSFILLTALRQTTHKKAIRSLSTFTTLNSGAPMRLSPNSGRFHKDNKMPQNLPLCQKLVMYYAQQHHQRDYCS